MNATRLVCALVIGLASVQANCFGAIVLNINPATEQLWFSGSDTGYLESIGAPPWGATWQLDDGDFGGIVDLLVPAGAFEPAPLVAQLDLLVDESNNLTGLSFFLSYDTNPGEIEILADPDVKFSYKAVDSGLLQSLVDDLNSLTSGTLAPTDPDLEWGSISIVQVPEPTSLVLLGTACGFAAVVAMKRSRARRRDGARQSSQRNA